MHIFLTYIDGSVNLRGIVPHYHGNGQYQGVGGGGGGGVINPMQGEEYQQEVVAFNYNTTLCTNRNLTAVYVLLPWQRGTN